MKNKKLKPGSKEWFVSQPIEQRAMYIHGHKTYAGLNKNKKLAFFYWNTKKICDPHNINNIPPCPSCKKKFIQDGSGLIDPCLGKLPGVSAACCGHGAEEGYISFENGRIVRFNPIEIEDYKPWTKKSSKGANFKNVHKFYSVTK